MRYFKIALAAGASIVVAARLSPAHALPPVYPLDANGPIRQGHMCKAPEETDWDNIKTGYGYTHFYECGPHKRAHRETHATTHGHGAVAPREPSYPHYQHLDINGPIRQGRWCIANRPTNWDDIQTGYGYGYFYECAPVPTAGGHHRAHHANHAHHARHHPSHSHHHQRHHGHHRHALHLNNPATRYGMILSYTGCSDSYLAEQEQQFWQTIDNAVGIDTIVDSVVSSDDGIDLANGSVTVGGGGSVIFGNGGDDRLRADGGVPAPLVEAVDQPAVGFAWTQIAAGEQISHSMMRRETGERIVRIPFGSGQRHAPVDPTLALPSALRQWSPQLQLRREDVDAGQIALTRGDYSNPVQSDAGGIMSVTTMESGFAPFAALLGLVLAIATPIALIALQVPVADKAAVIDTISDPIAEAEWYVPMGNKLTVGQHTPSSSPLASLIKSAGLASGF
jgi:hypothetical protein